MDTIYMTCDVYRRNISEAVKLGHLLHAAEIYQDLECKLQTTPILKSRFVDRLNIVAGIDFFDFNNEQLLKVATLLNAIKQVVDK